MSRRNRRLAYVLALLGMWLLAPELAYADNCSSLNDCYYTLRAALAAAVGLGVFAAFMSLGLDLGPLVDSLKRRLGGPGGEAVSDVDEAQLWERSLGVVSLQDPAAARSRTSDAARTGEGHAGRHPGATTEAGQEGEAPVEAPTAGTQSERPGQEDLAQASRKRAPAEQSAEPAPGSEQSQHESRTVDHMRETRLDEGRGEPGRSGGRVPGAGEGDRATSPSGDAGDVADRAREVSEAFDPPQESAGAGEQAQRPEARSQQAVRPSEQAERPPMEQAQRPSKQAEPPGDALAEGQQASLQGERQPGQGQNMEAPPQDAPPGRYDRRGELVAEMLGDELAGDAMRDVEQIASVQGSRQLLDTWPLASPPAMRGALAELRYAARLVQEAVPLASVAHHKEGRRAADVVLQDGTVVEVKDYDWSGAYFLQADNLQEAGRRLVRQTEWLRQRYPGQALQVAFTDLHNAPAQLVHLLQSVGIGLRHAPLFRAGKALLEKEWEPDAYWDGLEWTGWTAEVAPQRRARLRASLEQTFAHGPVHPWLTLADVVLDSESIYELHAQGESYHAHLEALARASSGLFRPENVRNARRESAGEETFHLTFDHRGQRYQLQTTADSDYIDLELLSVVNRALSDAGQQKRLVLLPAVDQLMYMAWVTPATYERALALAMIPASQ